MQDYCDKSATSITPCEFPLANEICPIGYISTDCVNNALEDETYTGITKGELITITLQKIIDFIKTRINNISSTSINVSKTISEQGINIGLEVDISDDEGNQLIKGTDNKLYAIPQASPALEDTNTIDLFKNPSTKAIKGNVRYVQSNSINLSDTPSGLKSDLKIDASSSNILKITENGLSIDIGVLSGFIVNNPLSKLEVTDYWFASKKNPGSTNGGIYIKGYTGNYSNIFFTLEDGTKTNPYADYGVNGDGWRAFAINFKNLLVKRITIEGEGVIWRTYDIPVYTNPFPATLVGNLFTVTNPTVYALTVYVRYNNNDALSKPAFTILPNQTVSVNLGSDNFTYVELAHYSSNLTYPINKQ